ncbi:MAG: PorT family protein [Muribaculaceae bacterium]|nr:PorT family protein [Muribaculaceae bacterium]
MKATKKLITLLLAMLACMSASAQVKFGAKVGLDLTNFWGKECGHQIVLNYQAGLLMEYKFHPHFGISPEVVFAAQGGQEKADDGSEMGGFIRSDKHYHTNYINVPVMFKYYPTQDFSIDFGPQVGFNVYSKYTMGKHEATNYKDKTKAVDFGLGLGCTYDLDKNVFIQLRYTMGLTNAFKRRYTTAFVIDNYRKNGNAQLAFGVRF